MSVIMNARSDEQHRALAEGQKAEAERIAAKIDAGEPLTLLERKFAAAMLRRAGREIPRERPNAARRPRTKLHDAIAFEAAMLIARKGMNPNEAARVLAERYGASVPALKRELGLVKHDYQAVKAEALNAALNHFGWSFTTETK